MNTIARAGAQFRAVPRSTGGRIFARLGTLFLTIGFIGLLASVASCRSNDKPGTSVPKQDSSFVALDSKNQDEVPPGRTANGAIVDGGPHEATTVLARLNKLKPQLPIRNPPPPPPPPPPPVRPPSGGSAATECELNGGYTGISGDDYMVLFALSLHHGIEDGYVPRSDELRLTAQKFESILEANVNAVIAFPAAPAGGTDQGYIQFASDYFIDRVNEVSGYQFPLFSVKDAKDFANLLDHEDNTAIAFAINWDMEAINNYSYPSPLQGSEGRNFGVFRLRHKPTGQEVIIISATVQYNDNKLKAGEVDYLLKFGKATADLHPTFIIADLNSGADDVTVLSADPAYHYMRDEIMDFATWYDAHQSCQNVPGYTAFDTNYGSIINTVLLKGAAAARVEPRWILFDPDKPSVAGEPDPNAPNINFDFHTPAGERGIAINHQMHAFVVKFTPCIPHCIAGDCGGDGCAGSCQCDGSLACVKGKCIVCECKQGKCGVNGCGRNCACSASDQCVSGSCEPRCRAPAVWCPATDSCARFAGECH